MLAKILTCIPPLNLFTAFSRAAALSLSLVGTTPDKVWADEHGNNNTAGFLLGVEPFNALHGLSQYCARVPRDCKTSKTSQFILPLAFTPELWAAMNEINDLVNSSITPQRDIDQFGKDEYWVTADRSGDCEDMVLLKMKLISERLNIPKNHFSLAYVDYEQGHAAMIVYTDLGDFVLDNIHPDVVRVDEYPYPIIAVTYPGNFSSMVKVEIQQVDLGAMATASIPAPQPGP